MPSIVQKDCVVGVAYVLKDKAEEVLDESLDEPLYYLHGHKNIIEGLEKNLEGMRVGEEKDIVVLPLDGYGEYHSDLVMAFDKSSFPEDVELEIDAELSAETPDGTVMFRVKEIGDTEVLMDANHPLAGETLYFHVKINSIRTATSDELSHGHIHGPDGHDDHDH